MSTNVANFGTTNHVVAGNVVNLASTAITILNAGNQVINGATINVISMPIGLTGATVTLAGTKIVNNYQFSIQISATPTTAGIIDMSGFSCTVTPN